jgi:hypothetical protein
VIGAQPNSTAWLSRKVGSIANDDETWPYQIQKSDEDAILDDDHVAHRLVVEGAKLRRPHHVAALRYLREFSKPELKMVLQAEHWSKCLGVTDDELDLIETEVFGEVITR